jgi:hypothetical protein
MYFKAMRSETCAHPELRSVTATLNGNALSVAARLEVGSESASCAWREHPTGLVQGSIPLLGLRSQIASATVAHGLLTLRANKTLGSSGCPIHVVSRPRLKAQADPEEVR